MNPYGTLKLVTVRKGSNPLGHLSLRPSRGDTADRQRLQVRENDTVAILDDIVDSGWRAHSHSGGVVFVLSSKDR